MTTTDFDLLTYETPGSPVLELHEIEQAVQGGCVIGLIQAMARKASQDVETQDAIRQATKSRIVASAHQHMTNYRSGVGGADQLEFRKLIERQAVAAHIIAEALEIAATWVSQNPGRIEVTPSHSSGRRRVFDRD